ncbi:TrkH family potassium uptake protein [Acidihalobacter prosperus]|uniref:Trk system potassium uptake protein n=1 Tax=Acidihalobacter prosperus TaxID=160660 RepID=A0A1A6C125_9GAMM|nr:TrkH family potassium uptake protein [Acidihalobacter prosperus]OBS08267.1 potassium transporter [Acidihalobacter prosperus]
MQIAAVQRVLGALIAAYSVTMLVPAVVSMIYDDGQAGYFLDSFLVTFALGFVAWFPVRNSRQELRRREGFLIVALYWAILSAVSTLPFHFSPHLDFTDAFFESVSGFTTTGATVIVGLDHLPKSILYYRAQLNWLGGMGIIVLAIAVLPMLRVGGMQLFRAETPGPMKDEKLTPRLEHTARALWGIYVGLTVACVIAYWVAGMSFFDALCQGFATIATGGFSTHDASFAYWNSPWIDGVADVFMFLSGMNFAVHYLALMRGSARPYFIDPEVRAYIGFVAASILVVSLTLWYTKTYPTMLTDLRYGAFQVLTVLTCCGFTSAPFNHWPLYLPVLLMLIPIVGGCAGSTAGGMKVVRVLLVVKQGFREMKRLNHPRAVVPVKLGRTVLPERVISAIWSFLAAYVLVYLVLMLALMGAGLDWVTAFSAVSACINNMGPGLGSVFANFAGISEPAKWICSLAMLIGRLEVFTLLVLLTPMYWRS